MDTTSALNSLLIDPEQHPLLPAFTVLTLGSTVVFAPHSDDETLGCGGLLALLGERGLKAQVVVVTDGSRSHPNSLSYPAARLSALRESETLDALSELGLPEGSAQFLRFLDCGLPGPGTLEFDAAASQLHDLIVSLSPDTIFVPWRRDPHCDHEATWALLRAACTGLEKSPRWLEYPVWAWTRAESEVAPRADEGEAWRLDISSILPRKERAIAQYRSQMGEVITDDPDGFALKASMLAHFAHPWELFIEPNDV